jgi:hypothetical protein
MNPNNETLDTTVENPQEHQKGQIIEILKLGGIENVSPDTADKLMSGIGVSEKDQLLIASILGEWQGADKQKKEDLAFTFANIVKRGAYLRLED